jgi:hypothetical protein
MASLTESAIVSSMRSGSKTCVRMNARNGSPAAASTAAPSQDPAVADSGTRPRLEQQRTLGKLLQRFDRLLAARRQQRLPSPPFPDAGQMRHQLAQCYGP